MDEWEISRITDFLGRCCECSGDATTRVLLKAKNKRWAAALTCDSELCMSKAIELVKILAYPE